MDAEDHSMHAGHKNHWYLLQGIESEGRNVQHPQDSMEEVPHTPYPLKLEPASSTIQAGTPKVPVLSLKFWFCFVRLCSAHSHCGLKGLEPCLLCPKTHCPYSRVQKSCRSGSHPIWHFTPQTQHLDTNFEGKKCSYGPLEYMYTTSENLWTIWARNHDVCMVLQPAQANIL